MTEYVTLTIRPNLGEAHRYATVLEKNGIACLVNGSRLARFTGQLTPSLIRGKGTSGGVELQVEEKDLLVARTLLNLDGRDDRGYIGLAPDGQPVPVFWAVLAMVVVTSGLALAIYWLFQTRSPWLFCLVPVWLALRLYRFRN